MELIRSWTTKIQARTGRNTLFLKRDDLKKAAAIAAHQCLTLLEYEILEGNYDKWTEEGIERDVAADAVEILMNALGEFSPSWPMPPE